MPKTANLFRLLSEFIVFLLGALMIVLALSGRVGLPGRPATLVLLGIVLLYWGARAWIHPRGKRANALPETAAHRAQARVRAGSLVLVGLLVLAIRLFPLRDAEMLLILAGSVLVLRGLLGGVLLLRPS